MNNKFNKETSHNFSTHEHTHFKVVVRMNARV